jgi:hypothetical protein
VIRHNDDGGDNNNHNSTRAVTVESSMIRYFVPYLYQMS